MDLAEIFRVIRRRWYVLLPGLLLTAALAAAVLVADPTKYQSQATVELLNSQKATVSFDGNPFLSTQVALTSMADTLSRDLNSDASVAALKSQGLTGTSNAMIADNAEAPLLWLTVTGTNSAEVLKSDRIMAGYAAQRLQQLQQQLSVNPDAMIRMMTIVPPQAPAAQTKTKIEYMALAGVLGLALTLAGCFYAEARTRPRVLPESMAVENSAAGGADGDGDLGDEGPDPDGLDPDGLDADGLDADGPDAEAAADETVQLAVLPATAAGTHRAAGAAAESLWLS